MLFNSHILRYYRNNNEDNIIKKFLDYHNLPLIYYFEDSGNIFFITIIANNIIVFQTTDNNYKYIYLPVVNQTPENIRVNNFYSNNNNQNSLNFYNNLRIFNIPIQNLYNYTPNFTFQNTLFDIFNNYETRKNLSIITDISFFSTNNKSNFLNELYNSYQNNIIPLQIINNIITEQPFYNIQSSAIYDIRFEELLLPNINNPFIINNSQTDNTYNIDTTIFNIYYTKFYTKSILGAYNSYHEFSNLNIYRYIYYINDDIIKYIIFNNQDSTNKNLFLKTFIVNNSICSDDIILNKTELTYNYNPNYIHSNDQRISKILDHIKNILDSIDYLINLQRTNRNINKTVDLEYLTFLGIREIYSNIPGLNNISNILKSYNYRSAFNIFDTKDPDITNLPFIDNTNINLKIFPRITLNDINTNSSISFNFVFLNNSNEIIFPNSMDRYDYIIMDNYFNNDRVTINRNLDNNNFILSNLNYFTIKYFDNTEVYRDYNSSDGNILYYLQRIKENIFNQGLNSHYTNFKLRYNISINKKILDFIDTTRYGEFELSGLAINKNLNLNSSINLINNISLHQNYMNNTNILNNLKNLNNLHKFPLPIIRISNKIVYIPSLSISAINTVNTYFNQNNYKNSLINDGIDLLDVCNEIISILNQHLPDNTDDINTIKNYLTMSYNIIKNGGNTNEFALIFSMNHKESGEIYPFLIYNGRGNVFLQNSSLNLLNVNNNISFPSTGIRSINSNNVERNIFVDLSNEGIFEIEMEPLNTFTYNAQFSSMPIIIPLDYIEILNIPNIFSTIRKIELFVDRVTDLTNKSLIREKIDITNLSDIYDPGTNRHYIYLSDSTKIYVDYVKIKFFVEVPKYSFEFTDLIYINIRSKFNELNRSSEYKLRVRYIISNNVEYTISNMIPIVNNQTFISNNYYLNEIFITMYNINDRKTQTYLNPNCLFIIPLNFNVYIDTTFSHPDTSKILYDLSNYDPTLNLSNIYILNLINNNLNYSKINNILYLNPLYDNINKYCRGYIKVINQSPNISFNIYNPYENTNYNGYKKFLEGKISNLKSDVEDFNDYLKFYKIYLDTSVGNFVSKTNIPIEFVLYYKFYDNKNDFLNDISYTEKEIRFINLFEILSFSDYITSENTYSPNLLYIIRKEEVYPEFGIPKNYIFNLQMKIKTRDATNASISNVYFDIYNSTNDIEVGIIKNLSDYTIGDNIYNYINRYDFIQTSDSEEILKYFNRYLLLKTSSMPNANEIVLNGIIRIRPKYYGINFASLSINSFITNLKIQQIIPYLYITEYGNVLSVYKNSGIIHQDDIISNSFKDILPDQAKELNFYPILSKFRQPINSYSSIWLLNCTNRTKNLEFNLITNSSGKIFRGNNKISLSIGPYEFKNIKINEPISLNDYTNNNSGIIKFDLTNISDNYIIDKIDIPIPSLDKYIYEMMSFIDNLNINKESESIKVTRSETKKERDFDVNIMITNINNSVTNQIGYFDSSTVQIFKNIIDETFIVSIGENDFKRCNDYISNFSNIISNGFISIPIDLNSMINNITITYTLINDKKITFSLKNLKSFIINDLISKFNISINEADSTANNILLNNYININIPGNIYNNTIYTKCTFRRTNILEQDFKLYFELFINITDILNNYVKEYILKELKIGDIKFYDINDIKLTTNIITFKIEDLLMNLFIGFNIKSSEIIYNNLFNKIPNLNQDQLKDEIIQKSGNIKIKYISTENKYIYKKQQEYPIIKGIKQHISNINIHYGDKLGLIPEPDEALEIYLRYKDIYERNNYFTRYIIEFDYNNVNNLNPIDLRFIPILNENPFKNIDNLVITNIFINDLKLEQDQLGFFKRSSILKSNLIEINSLYNKVEIIKLNINNYVFGPYYNIVLPIFNYGRTIALQKSKIIISLPNEYDNYEKYEYSLKSKIPPKIIIKKVINPNKDLIGILDLIIMKYVEGNMVLNEVEIFHNLPGDIDCYVTTKDNDLFKMNKQNNKILINKEISRYLTGVEKIGNLLITGNLNKSGEYQIIFNLKYTLINKIKNYTIDLLVRVYKPSVLDNEYLIIEHERMDSPIAIDVKKFKEMKDSLDLLKTFKKYAYSHIRGLCGGGGFDYRDKFWDLE